jgi:hypothetical protein
MGTVVKIKFLCPPSPCPCKESKSCLPASSLVTILPELSRLPPRDMHSFVFITYKRGVDGEKIQRTIAAVI